MNTIEKDTQITILCSFEGQDENEFFNFDVCKRGDVRKSEILYNELLFQPDMLTLKYFIGETFVKGCSKIVNFN